MMLVVREFFYSTVTVAFSLPDGGIEMGFRTILLFAHRLLCSDENSFSIEAPVIIDCSVDYSENTRLTEKLSGICLSCEK